MHPQRVDFAEHVTDGAVLARGVHPLQHDQHLVPVLGVEQILQRIDRLGGLNAPHALFGKTVAQAYDTAAYKIAADELLLSAGVQLLFHAWGAGVVMDEPARVKALLVETKSGRRAVLGRAFVDASGDGDLAAWAGASFAKGDGGGNMLYPSTMFRINGIDPQRAGRAWETIPGLMLQAEAEGRYRFPRKTPIVRPQKSGIEWRVNLTQLANEEGNAIDGTDAQELSRAEVMGRRQIAEVVGLPVGDHGAELLGLVVEEGLLLRRERGPRRGEQLLPARLAREEIAVPPHGAGVDGVGLGRGHRRHDLAERREQAIAQQRPADRRDAEHQGDAAREDSENDEGGGHGATPR